MIRNRLVQALRPQLVRSSVVLACTVAASGYALASEQAVGQVSLLIGAARVVHMNGTSEPLKRGAAILVGDRVETSANGHVHVRFIDNGAVSVRPDSILEVQAYRYDVDKPQANEVRLRMEQGTSRSISGAATDADKNRFRLNTPIAAIGVRGTDFIVQSDASGVRATVADGAIVVGALGNGCSAAALGPCTGADARLLSADMGRLMAEVRPGERTTHVVPAAGGIAAVAGAEERVAAMNAAESAARAASLAAAEAKGFAPLRESDRAAADLLSIASASVAELNSPADLTAQLVWGRWRVSGAAANDNVSVQYSKVIDGRHWTTANNRDGDVLLRMSDPSNPNQELRPISDTPIVEMRLSRAQASFEYGNKQTEAATVNGGSLTLDFDRRTFATALGLSSPTGGKAELRMGGDIASDGTFAVRSNTQMVSGALSLDGKEAGYLFERAVGNGLFRGKTLWGR